MVYEKQSDKIDNLKKSLTEAQGAIRRLTEQTASNLSLISKLREDVEVLRQELNRVKGAVEKTQGLYDNQIQRYE